MPPRPRICAEFSEPLVEAGVDYAPFVQLRDVRACRVGARAASSASRASTHGERYSVDPARRACRPNPAKCWPSRCSSVSTSATARPRCISRAGPTCCRRRPMPGCRWWRSTPPTLDLTLSRLPDRNLVRAFDEDWFGRALTDLGRKLVQRDARRAGLGGHRRGGLRAQPRRHHPAADRRGDRRHGRRAIYVLHADDRRGRTRTTARRPRNGS